jgi:hypothetical protein
VWWRSLWLTLLLFWGGGGISAAVVGSVVPRGSSWLAVLSLVPWVVAVLFVSQGPIRWKCPRCGEAFHAGAWGTNGFARRCVHCKLRKWAPSDPSASEEIE